MTRFWTEPQRMGGLMATATEQAQANEISRLRQRLEAVERGWADTDAAKLDNEQQWHAERERADEYLDLIRSIHFWLADIERSSFTAQEIKDHIRAMCEPVIFNGNNVRIEDLWNVRDSAHRAKAIKATRERNA